MVECEDLHWTTARAKTEWQHIRGSMSGVDGLNDATAFSEFSVSRSIMPPGPRGLGARMQQYQFCQRAVFEFRGYLHAHAHPLPLACCSLTHDVCHTECGGRGTNGGTSRSGRCTRWRSVLNAPHMRKFSKPLSSKRLAGRALGAGIGVTWCQPNRQQAICRIVIKRRSLTRSIGD